MILYYLHDTVLSVKCKNMTKIIFSLYSKNTYKMRYSVIFLAYIVLLLFKVKSEPVQTEKSNYFV